LKEIKRRASPITTIGYEKKEKVQKKSKRRESREQFQGVSGVKRSVKSGIAQGREKSPTIR